jgi:uncharacterized protein with HEPN domain
MSDRDKLVILGMLEAIGKIEKIASDIDSLETFENDFKSFDACLMNFIVLGELVLRLNNEFITKHSDIEWHKIKAFRNMVAHDYFGIDAEKVWDIIQNKIPQLRLSLEKIN